MIRFKKYVNISSKYFTFKANLINCLKNGEYKALGLLQKCSLSTKKCIDSSGVATSLLTDMAYLNLCSMSKVSNNFDNTIIHESIETLQANTQELNDQIGNAEENISGAKLDSIKRLNATIAPELRFVLQQFRDLRIKNEHLERDLYERNESIRSYERKIRSTKYLLKNEEKLY